MRLRHTHAGILLDEIDWLSFQLHRPGPFSEPKIIHPLTYNPHQFSFAAYVSKNISSISFMITIGSSDSCPSLPYRCFTVAGTKMKSTAAAICL